MVLVMVVIMVVHGMFEYEVRWGDCRGFRCCIANVSPMMRRLWNRLPKWWEVIVGTAKGCCLHGGFSCR